MRLQVVHCRNLDMTGCSIHGMPGRPWVVQQVVFLCWGPLSIVWGVGCAKQGAFDGQNHILFQMLAKM
jgi:hypothetical protein